MIDFKLKTLRAIYRPSDGCFWCCKFSYTGWTEDIEQAWTEDIATLMVRKMFEDGWVGADDVRIVALWPDLPEPTSAR